jgi:uncharacterized membrane protein
MNDTTATIEPTVTKNNMAFIIYILYIVGFFTGITALIGVVMAHINSNTADSVLNSHFKYQIRTFYWGLLWVVIGSITSVIVVGWFILLAWLAWTVYRVIKGLLALNERKSIA